jgi:hypothetical protein
MFALVVVMVMDPAHWPKWLMGGAALRSVLDYALGWSFYFDTGDSTDPKAVQ